MAKMSRTENLYTDPGSIFLEYAWSNHHFAISLQKQQFLMKNCIFNPVNIKKNENSENYKFSKKNEICRGSKIQFFIKN